MFSRGDVHLTCKFYRSAQPAAPWFQPVLDDFVALSLRCNEVGKQETDLFCSGRDSAARGRPGIIFEKDKVVTIPSKTVGFISVKATYKLKGLVNV